MMEKRNCRNCGKEFQPRCANGCFCSWNCHKKYHQVAKKEKKTRILTCPYCHVEFETTDLIQKFCKSECREKMADKRLREKKNAYQLAHAY